MNCWVPFAVAYLRRAFPHHRNLKGSGWLLSSQSPGTGRLRRVEEEDHFELDGEPEDGYVYTYIENLMKANLTIIDHLPTLHASHANRSQNAGNSRKLTSS